MSESCGLAGWQNVLCEEDEEMESGESEHLVILGNMGLAYSLEELGSVSVERDGVREKKEQESDMEKGMVCFFLLMGLSFWGNIYLG